MKHDATRSRGARILAALLAFQFLMAASLAEAQAILSPKCTGPDAQGTYTCNFTTMHPEDWLDYAFINLPINAPGVEIPSLTAITIPLFPDSGCKVVDKQVVCYSGQVNGVVILKDPDAGLQYQKPQWGPDCWVRYCASFVGSCNFPNSAIVANSCPVSSLSPLLETAMTWSRVLVDNKGNPQQLGGLVCILGPSDFVDDGANTTYGEDVGGSCIFPSPPLAPPQDTSVSVRYAVNTVPRWSLPSQQKALIAAVKYLEVIGVALVGVGRLAAKSPLTFAAVGAVASAVTLLGALADKLAENDPPDLNFTTVVTPTPPQIDVSTYSPATQQLIQTLEQAIGFANAIETTTDRATGALLMADAASQQLQQQALPGFEQEFAAVMAQLPGAFTSWGQELLGNGVDPRTATLADVNTAIQSIATNGFPDSYQATFTALGADASTVSSAQALAATADPLQTLGVLQNVFNTGPIMPPVLPASSNLQLFAAVLPASRSVQVGNVASAFATLINAGTSTAHSCGIGSGTAYLLGDNFFYQTTNPSTNALTGTPYTPVDIAPGSAQTFLIEFTPSAAHPPIQLDSIFFCANANVAPINPDINTLLVSADVNPVPDAIAVGLTPSNDGYAHTGGSPGTGVFVISSTNIGVAGTLTAQAVPSNQTMPLSTVVCQTNPNTGQCLHPPAPTASATINQNQSTTWSAFLQATGPIPADPTNNRVIFQFVDSQGVVRGATSTAVTTQ
jgi:hypothetical protein